MRKPVLGVSDQVNTNGFNRNRIGLTFWLWDVEGLYYLCSENKGADLRMCGYRTADLRLCFLRVPKSRFSHDTLKYTISLSLYQPQHGGAVLQETK